MEVIFYSILFINTFYFFLLYYAKKKWEIQPTVANDMIKENLYISVIIVVRNEEKNILNLLQDLENQLYKNFEVIFVDDHSEDNTHTLIKTYKAKSLKIKLLSLSEGLLGKKTAITEAMKMADGEVIVRTDGDCRVEKEWLQIMSGFFYEKKAEFVSGAVIVTTHTLWYCFQAIEFISLIGVGALSIGSKKPTMCNGANLAYRKKTFFEVNGYQENKKIASGDDEFLMHKIAEKYPDKIFFLKNKLASTKTIPEKNLYLFFQQRIRWVSKVSNYKNKYSKYLAFWVLFFHSLQVMLFMGLINSDFLFHFFIALLIRFTAEFLFLSSLLRFYYKIKLIFLVPIVSFFYPFYVVVVSILSLLKPNYQWKKRKMSSFF